MSNSKQVNIEKANVIVLMELDNEIHLISMSRDNLDACSLMVKHSVDTLIRTERTYRELLTFVGWNRTQNKKISLIIRIYYSPGLVPVIFLAILQNL